MQGHQVYRFLVLIASFCFGDSFVIKSYNRDTTTSSFCSTKGDEAAAAAHSNGQSAVAASGLPNSSTKSDEAAAAAAHSKGESASAASGLIAGLSDKEITKIESRLLKNMRETCQKYDMIEEGDHLMVCVSGGKDSATLLHLLQHLQKRFARPGGIGGTNFEITAVHLNQVQPGYDGTKLQKWLDSVGVRYRLIEEDTYSIVKAKTPEHKTYCSLCSRLRRGILYSIAHEIGATKIALGHHGDDAIETMLLNAVHSGQLKSMPARYYSTDRDMHVIRPLISCLEDDIRSYAQAKNFPILPCNLCGSQPDAHRAKVKLLCNTLDALNPNARQNLITAMGDIRPSHLLDVGLREACGLDAKTGQVLDKKRASLIRGFDLEARSGNGTTINGDKGLVDAPDGSDNTGLRDGITSTFIEGLL